jgi:hypothetical protein
MKTLMPKTEKMSRLRKYFGIISDKKAKEMSRTIKKIRKGFVVNVRKYY